MPNTTIKQILDRTGKDQFYLMHLRWGRNPHEENHRRLWEFAKKKQLIGLDYTRGPTVNSDWRQFPMSQKQLMSRDWPRQFDTFYAIEEGDCIVVPDGQTQLLGIALARKEVEFRPSLSNFFRHVRRVDWLKAFEWDERLDLPLALWFAGFRNTIQRVNAESSHWKIIKLDLELDREVPLLAPTIDNSNDSGKKYGPKGEGPNHRALKEWILEHPEGIGLLEVVGKHLEYEFVTGDRADIVFDLRNGRHAVVEIETSDPNSIMIGAHQALKYRVLMNAKIGAEIGSDKVSSFLVAEIEPEDLQFCRDYKINFVKKKL